MVKKRIIGTIATAVLGLTLVGVANADTVDNLMSPRGMDLQQAKTNITQQEMITRQENMPDFSMDKEQVQNDITVVSQDTKDIKDTTKDTKDTENSKKEKQSTAIMGPNNMTQMPESMVEFHEENYDQMVEMHESMPQNQMNGYMGQMGRQMHAGGMNGRNMMGN